jgi:hypothetical protein
MKKLFSILLAGTISITAIHTGHAQSDGGALLPIRNAGGNAAAIKATSQFWDSYGESKHENWYPLPDGFLAEFTEGNVLTKAVYSKNGNWVYTIRQYTEKELPVDVRALVKQTYYDDTIGVVKEVIQPGYTTYLIHIEDNVRWKTIRVRDDEMEVVQDFRKCPAQAMK